MNTHFVGMMNAAMGIGIIQDYPNSCTYTASGNLQKPDGTGRQPGVQPHTPPFFGESLSNIPHIQSLKRKTPAGGLIISHSGKPEPTVKDKGSRKTGAGWMP